MSVEFYILLAVIASLAGGFALGFYYRGRRDPLDDIEARLENTFKAVASTALSQSTTELLKLSEERFKALAQEGNATLEEKKKLIDASLQGMGETLKGLLEGLATSREQTDRLRSTTEKLHQVLHNPQKRGQWGERMVEDILNIIGLKEGINYEVHAQLGSGERPDYTFLLPENKKINLDVKFPIDKYELYLNTKSEVDAEKAKREFLSTVKYHVKVVSSRGYIDPEAGTVDYVMVFIPNESIYSFIHQNDPDLLEFALQNHIILCSPITLYAVLSLVRQAVRSFSVEERAGDIMNQLTVFHRQWAEYVGKMDKLGRSLDAAKGDYDLLVTTRTRALEKPLNRIAELQEGRQEDLLKE